MHDGMEGRMTAYLGANATGRCLGAARGGGAYLWVKGKQRDVGDPRKGEGEGRMTARHASEAQEKAAWVMRFER